MGIKFSLENLISTFPIIAKGMLGIFVVTIVIIAITYIINGVTKNKE